MYISIRWDVKNLIGTFKIKAALAIFFKDVFVAVYL